MNKYHAIKTTIDGIRFDSKGEALRYLLLKDRLSKREITDLRRQVLFTLHGRNGATVCRYKADFMYQEGEQLVVEDYKGVETRDFVIKRKLFQDNYPDIEFRTVGKARAA